MVSMIRFDYMAISDTRQRVMPTAEDRARGKPLAYPEAVLLTNPSNPDLKGEVDDKYQYASDSKDNKVHGWISQKSGVGFWIITPSDEFRISGPLKQELTSHAGPVSLSVSITTINNGFLSLVSLRRCYLPTELRKEMITFMMRLENSSRLVLCCYPLFFAFFGYSFYLPSFLTHQFTSRCLRVLITLGSLKKKYLKTGKHGKRFLVLFSFI